MVGDNATKMGFFHLLSSVFMWGSLSLLSCLVGLLFYRIWWKPMKLQAFLRQQGINGHPYKLLFGNTNDISCSLIEAHSKPMKLTHHIAPRVTPFLHQTVKDYGKLAITWIGTIPRVIIMDPELIRIILFEKASYFEKVKANPLTRMLVTGVATYNGEKWGKHRRILNPAFHQLKLKRMLHAMFTSCSELINRWEELVGSEGSCEINIWAELGNLTGDVISRTGFGSSYKEGMQIFRLQTEQAELAVKAGGKIYVPGLRFLPTKDNIRRKEINKQIRDLVLKIIQKRQTLMITGDANNTDLLGLMMESNYRESQESNNAKSIGMTIEEVIEECKLFYLAGQETTSALLTWTMVLLSMHRHWQQRAREEVSDVFGNNKPDFDGLNHLKIVTMIFYEVLRLYPPISLLNRQACRATRLGEFTLPPGVQVSLPTLLVHHDREIWGEDAEEFKPERFSGGLLKVSKHQVPFFPFGWGPRICIGQNFALQEAKLALSMILQKFSFELSPSYVHAPYAIITLQPQHGAQLIFNKF